MNRTPSSVWLQDDSLSMRQRIPSLLLLFHCFLLSRVLRYCISESKVRVFSGFNDALMTDSKVNFVFALAHCLLLAFVSCCREPASYGITSAAIFCWLLGRRYVTWTWTLVSIRNRAKRSCRFYLVIDCKHLLTIGQSWTWKGSHINSRGHSGLLVSRPGPSCVIAVSTSRPWL